MKLFKKVAVIGTGLIGGSIAVDLKKRKLAGTVLGISRRKESLAIAKKSGAIDIGSQDALAAADADLVIFATPVSAILRLAPVIAPVIKPGCIVTDVGSTKEEIVTALSSHFARFVGSHPLAGSEKRGMAHARQGLFKNSLCVLTPVKNTDTQALRKIRSLWVSLGAKTVLLSPKAHDRILSRVSHLPHAIAFSLAGSLEGDCLDFAPPSLKDATRVASSDSGLWADIFLSNRRNLLESIDVFNRGLARLTRAVRKQDRARLVRILDAAKRKRASLK